MSKPVECAPVVVECPEQVEEAADVVLDDLRRDNVTLAVALGIAAGEAAIRDVLRIGPRVLGEFKGQP